MENLKKVKKLLLPRFFFFASFCILLLFSILWPVVLTGVIVSGYPYNLDFDYGALAQLQHFSINNLGDPFIESNYGVHSRQFEVGVLDWFARLWELENNEYWGYITNCGTEGNLHGILVGWVACCFSFMAFLSVLQSYMFFLSQICDIENNLIVQERGVSWWNSLCITRIALFCL